MRSKHIVCKVFQVKPPTGPKVFLRSNQSESSFICNLDYSSKKMMMEDFSYCCDFCLEYFVSIYGMDMDTANKYKETLSKEAHLNTTIITEKEFRNLIMNQKSREE